VTAVNSGSPVVDSGRVALITGAAKANGIGAACARRLSRDGFTVVVADVAVGGVSGPFEPDSSASGLDSLVSSLAQSGGSASSAQGDISSEPEATALVEQVVARHGRLDVLVNNAAAPQRREGVPLDELEPSEWDRVMAINSRGTFLMCQAAYRTMKQQAFGHGRIVNIASIAGRVGLPRMAAYSSSKASVIGLTRALAMDAAPFDITVNAVCPGFVDTNRVASGVRRNSPDDPDQAKAGMIARVPAGRLGRAEDIANAAAFFAAIESDYVTGQVLNVDGGLYAI